MTGFEKTHEIVAFYIYLNSINSFFKNEGKTGLCVPTMFKIHLFLVSDYTGS